MNTNTALHIFLTILGCASKGVLSAPPTAPSVTTTPASSAGVATNPFANPHELELLDSTPLPLFLPLEEVLRHSSRALEQVPECPGGVGHVDCYNGYVLGNSTQPCDEACGGECCIGNNACVSLTGRVCKDGVSCTGGIACAEAHVDLISDSCFGYQSCIRAGRGQAGGTQNIRSISGSCKANIACYQIGNNHSSDIAQIEDCCNSDNACNNVHFSTELPPECPRYTHPPTNSPIGSPTPWMINFVAMQADFSATNLNEEISLEYEIPKGKDYDTQFYAGHCVARQDLMSPVSPVGVISMNTSLIEESGDPLMSTLKINHDVNKTLITGSNIWNAESSQLELCQVVRLKLLEMVIYEDLRNITMVLDTTANFTTSIGLDEATLNAANATVDLDSFISAYHCDGGDGMLEREADHAPNEEFHTCILSESADVEIEAINSMTISGIDPAGEASQLEVVEDGVAFFAAITSLRFLNATSVIVTTRVPANLFDYQREGATIVVEGGVTLNLKDGATGGRKLITGGATDVARDRRLRGLEVADAEKASFDLSVKLGAGSADEDDIAMLSSAEDAVGGAVLAVVGMVFAAASFW